MNKWKKHVKNSLIVIVILFLAPLLFIFINKKSNIDIYILTILFELFIFLISYGIFELRVRVFYNKIVDRFNERNTKNNIQNHYTDKFMTIDTLINFDYFLNEEIDKVFQTISNDKERIKVLEKENYMKYHVKEYQLKSAVTELEKMNDSLKKKEELLDNFIELIENTDNINMSYDMFFDEVIYYMERLLRIKDSIILKKEDGDYKVYSKLSKELKITEEIKAALDMENKRVTYKSEINELLNYDLVIKICSDKWEHGFLLINDFNTKYLNFPVYMKMMNTISIELSNIADNLYNIETLKKEKKQLEDNLKYMKMELEDQEKGMEAQIMQMTDMYEEIVTLYEAGKNIGKIFDIEKIEEVAIEMILETVEAEFGLVFYYSAKKIYPEISKFIFSEEENQKIIEEINNLAKNTSIFIGLKEKGSEIVVNDITESDYYEELNYELKSKIKNFIQVPIFKSTEIVGGVAIFNRKSDFTAGNINLVTALTNQLGMSVQNVEYVSKEIERKREEEQLKIASKIQADLFPQKMPILKNFQFSGSNVPAKAVGGDYFDLVKIDENTVMGIISDVSGKGIPAALLVSMVRTIFRMLVEHNKEYSTDKILYHLNNILANESVEGSFVTSICFKFMSDERKIELANAGHDPAYLYDSKKEKLEEYDLEGTVLGIMPEEKFEKKTIKMNKDDAFILYTDGVIEARNENGDFYGFDRLFKIVEKNNKFPSDYILRKMKRSVNQFLNGSNQNDDITMIVVKGL